MLKNIITDTTRSLFNDKGFLFKVDDEIVTLNKHQLKGIITKMWEGENRCHYVLVKFVDQDRICRLNSLRLYDGVV